MHSETDFNYFWKEKFCYDSNLVASSHSRETCASWDISRKNILVKYGIWTYFF